MSEPGCRPAGQSRALRAYLAIVDRASVRCVLAQSASVPGATPHPLAWLALVGLVLARRLVQAELRVGLGERSASTTPSSSRRRCCSARRRRRSRSAATRSSSRSRRREADAPGRCSTPRRWRSRCGSRRAPSSLIAGVAPLAASGRRRSRRWSCRCSRMAVVYFVAQLRPDGDRRRARQPAVAGRRSGGGISAGSGSAISAPRRWRSA